VLLKVTGYVDTSDLVEGEGVGAALKAHAEVMNMPVGYLDRLNIEEVEES
jgi:hypothetical protein